MNMTNEIENLKVNDIVLVPADMSVKRCVIKNICDDTVEVGYLNTQTGEMEKAIISLADIEPVILMESTLCALGFKKSDKKFYGSPNDMCYILKRNGQEDVVVIKTLQWHLLLPHGDCWSIDKKELYLHTLQNYLSNGKDFADAVSYEKFVELTKPYCISL